MPSSFSSDLIDPPATRRAPLGLTAIVLVSLVLGAAACGDDSDATSTGDESAAGCEAVDGQLGVADAGSPVGVTLREFAIAVDPDSSSAGAVGLRAHNAGEESHELVLAKGVPADIRIVDGAPDEAALGDALIGEIEAFGAGDTCEATFEMEAGDYVLFCALTETEEDGTIESHFEEGMVTTFTVE